MKKTYAITRTGEELVLTGEYGTARGPLSEEPGTFEADCSFFNSLFCLFIIIINVIIFKLYVVQESSFTTFTRTNRGGNVES